MFALIYAARCEVYPASKIKRFVVPDEKVSWSEQFKDYKPVEYTSEVVLKGPVWADPIIRYVVFVFGKFVIISTEIKF